MSLQIREATPEDLNTLLKIEQELIKAERPFDPTIRPDPVSYYDLEAFIKDPDAYVIVACSGTKIVSTGYALIKEPRPYLDHESYAYLGFMFTVPEYRGKGINAKIIRALKAWAEERNLKEIRLTVYQDNVPAQRAYEKEGFKKHIIEMRLENNHIDK